MKTSPKKIIVALFSMLIITTTMNAQCTPPDLSFANPVLVSGTALMEGAVYKFSNVMPGIDCFITLVKLNGGATLVSMENVGLGYNDAWQPVIDGPGAPVGNKSWIDWKIEFKTTAGVNYYSPCLAICAIDVDGDNGNLGEFVESDGQATYEVAYPTVLTVTDKGNGRIEAQGPVANRAGIDTFSLDVRINYYFSGVTNIDLKIGQTVLGPGTGGATARFNSIYFKKVKLNPYSILPVNKLLLTATADREKVAVNWETDNEIKNVNFEVERSFDNSSFKKIASISQPSSTSRESRIYSMSDNATSTGGKEYAFYRVKAVDASGKFTYSNVVMVRLKTTGATAVQVSPNPFIGGVKVVFTSLQDGKADINIRNITGQTVTKTKATIRKGDNSIMVENLDGLSKGIYIVETFINGVVTNNQKIIKN